MRATENLSIRSITPIIAPDDLKQVFPVSETMAEFVAASRETIIDILHHRDDRLLVIVGPCSIHDPEAAVDYARRLKVVADELADTLFVVMRVYFEKPRTAMGWKGLINDPDLNGSHQISKGLGIARRLLCEITELRLPIATETLDPITPQYLAALVSWGAIGARTTESQTHREMASGLSFPVGIKNATDGNLTVAANAMKASREPHSFLGIGSKGRTAIVHTKGNPNVHLVLRGGSDGPNHGPEHVVRAEKILADEGLPTGLVVDCSHANSAKNPLRQPEVCEAVVTQVVEGARAICGVMVESNLEEGNQPIPEDLSKLRYGVSVTDGCLGWDDTEKMLRAAAKRLHEQ